MKICTFTHVNAMSFSYSYDGLSGMKVANSYRYGFGSMEKDDEIKGEGNSYDFGARMYDPRIGRWFSTDAFESKYASLSPYVFVANMPIIAKDPDGKRIIVLNKEALEAIKLTLTPEEASFLETDENGELNHDKLIEGLNCIGVDRVGGNFNALFEVSKVSDIVEVVVSQTYETVAGTKTYPSEIYNPAENSWIYNKLGNKDLSGEIDVDGVKFTYEQYVIQFKKDFPNELATVQGKQGVTQIPSKYFVTEEDINGNKKSLAAGGNSYDNLENRRVVINEALFNVNKQEASQKTAHELYGHALFSVLGKVSLHGDYHTGELEQQIVDREKEARGNYKMRQNEE